MRKQTGWNPQRRFRPVFYALALEGCMDAWRPGTVSGRVKFRRKFGRQEYETNMHNSVRRNLFEIYNKVLKE